MPQGNRLQRALTGLDPCARITDGQLMRELTAVLRLPSQNGEHEGIDIGDESSSFKMPWTWLRSQTILSQRLSSKLRKPSSFFGRMKMSLLHKTRANLCPAHEALDPRIVRDIFEMFMTECLSRNDYLRHAPLGTNVEVKAWLARLQAAAGIWLGPRQHYFPDDVVFSRLDSRCEACMLAVVGGNVRILTDLLVSARVHQRCLSEQAKPDGGEDADRFWSIVQSWIMHFDTTTYRSVREDCDRLVDSVLRCRHDIVNAPWSHRARQGPKVASPMEKLRNSDDPTDRYLWQLLSETKEAAKDCSTTTAKPEQLVVDRRDSQLEYRGVVTGQPAVTARQSADRDRPGKPAFGVGDRIFDKDLVSPLRKLARGDFSHVKLNDGSHVPQLRKVENTPRSIPGPTLKQSRDLSTQASNHWAPSTRRSNPVVQQSYRGPRIPPRSAKYAQEPTRNAPQSHWTASKIRRVHTISPTIKNATPSTGTSTLSSSGKGSSISNKPLPALPTNRLDGETAPSPPPKFHANEPWSAWQPRPPSSPSPAPSLYANEPWDTSKSKGSRSRPVDEAAPRPPPRLYSSRNEPTKPTGDPSFHFWM